jgi:hypothetical protein
MCPVNEVWQDIYDAQLIKSAMMAFPKKDPKHIQIENFGMRNCGYELNILLSARFTLTEQHNVTYTLAVTWATSN